MSDYDDSDLTGDFCRKCYGSNFGCVDCAAKDVTDRERFLHLLDNGPLVRADAVVVLCGEDAEPRLAVAEHVWKSGGAHAIVLSGGKHDPPRWRGAVDCRLTLLGHGIAPDRIVVEDQSQHTREQAVNVVALAQEQGWHSLLIAASPYHLPRAFLTFVQALKDANALETIRIVPLPASQTAWTHAPAGMETSRLDLFDADLAKIDEYAALGHVASYAEGSRYLLSWEVAP